MIRQLIADLAELTALAAMLTFIALVSGALGA